MTLVRDAIGQRVWPAHRLDRKTSGAVAFALDPEAAATLGAAFEAGTVEKRYLALVRGHLPGDGLIDHPVRKHERTGPKVPALTRWRCVAANERYTLVEVQPLTGRLHQIRRHFKHLNHPIVLDNRYGRGVFNEVARGQYGATRMMLHATQLVLPDPDTHELLTIDAPVPRDMTEPLQRLGLWPAGGLAK